MRSLGEVLASGLADISILNVSDVFSNPGPEFPFCFTYVLHAATSFEASHYMTTYKTQVVLQSTGALI